jgi:hypothetical protein
LIGKENLKKKKTKNEEHERQQSPLNVIVIALIVVVFYSSLANNRIYLQRDKSRMRIWFPFFSYFEENVKQALPNEYCLPDIIYDIRAKFNGCMDRMRYPTD